MFRRSLILESLEERAQPSATVPTLGTAGQFAVLGLQGTWIDNDGGATVNGDEGVSRNGVVLNQRSSTINGNVQEYSKNEYFGRGSVTGNVAINSSLIKQADADAATASAAAAALAPTQTFKTIKKATTVQGDGGLNVININGDVNASLTLSGGPNDVFVVNVTGSLSLDGKESLGLSGGVTANNVLYNFVGRHGGISTRHNSVVNGTLLAPRYDVDIGGLVNGEVIAGGDYIGFGHKATVNQVSFNGTGNSSTPGISGYVFDDLTGSGSIVPGDPALAGVVVTLTGTTANGTPVTMTATTDANGLYSFTSLAAGTYSLQRAVPAGYTNGGDTVGTINGVPNGTVQPDGSIGQIAYQAGGVGSGYGFAESPLPID
jgi:hypothetical protein